MTSTVSANGSTQSLSADPATAGNLSREGGMEELLPLVLQLTNAESVSAVFWFCGVASYFDQCLFLLFFHLFSFKK